jgi:tetratricopeptide (TPR) repeat protein
MNNLGGTLGNTEPGPGFNLLNTMIVITINEFRDFHQFINSSKQLPSMSHPSTQRPQEVSAAISDNSSLLPSRLSTLVDYVNHFIQNMTWSSEEIKLAYPDWYPGTSRNIAEEALSISLLNGDPKDIKVSRANRYPGFLFANMSHTHRHTLLNETTLSLLGMWEISPRPPEILLKALEMLDILFQLKLDPSMSDNFTLAQICEAKGENDEAETFYRQAINSFTEIDHQIDDKPLKVQHRFGKFLMKINRDEEALLTLLNGFASWLSNIWPVGAGSFYFRFWQNFYTDECEEIMKSLQALHVKMDQDETFAWVRGSVSRLQKLHQENSVNADDEEFLLEFMKLGAVYSEIWMLDAANLVFGFAAPRLEQFNSRHHAFERACAYRDYAQHWVKQGSPADQSKQMQFAFHCIQAVRRDGESLGQFSSPTAEYHGRPGPQEAHYELIAREDPALARWMRGEGFESWSSGSTLRANDSRRSRAVSLDARGGC